MDEKEVDLIKQTKLFLSIPENMITAAETVIDGLVDEIILGILFDVHRSAKTGMFYLEEGVPEENIQFNIVEDPDFDIFGKEELKEVPMCVCPICKRKLAPLKFAPHLENCMGMGRKSSRVSRQRIANNSKESVSYSGMASDYDDDTYWTSSSDRKRNKKDNNGTQRPKSKKHVRNGDTPVDRATSSNMNYNNMPLEEKRNMLTQICGVISKHTRKLCTRSMRCPQHTDEQRRNVRATLLNQPSDVNGDILQVEIDAYEDNEGHCIREAINRSWEQEHSNTSSPADSTSTSSSSSKKKEKI